MNVHAYVYVGVMLINVSSNIFVCDVLISHRHGRAGVVYIKCFYSQKHTIYALSMNIMLSSKMLYLIMTTFSGDGIVCVMYESHKNLYQLR